MLLLLCHRWEKSSNPFTSTHTQSTGLTGLAVATNPHHTLCALYGKIIRAVAKMPQDAAYRKSTEALVKQRADAVAQVCCYYSKWSDNKHLIRQFSLAQGHCCIGEGCGKRTSWGAYCASGKRIDTGTQDAWLEAVGETGGTHTGQAMGLATSTNPWAQSLVSPLSFPPLHFVNLLSRLVVDSRMKIKQKAAFRARLLLILISLLYMYMNTDA